MSDPKISLTALKVSIIDWSSNILNNLARSELISLISLILFIEKNKKINYLLNLKIFYSGFMRLQMIS